MTEERVFESIKFHKLRVCKEFWALSVTQFKKIYNGYGPDAWPKGMRAALSWVFDRAPEVAGSHDISFHFSDGTRDGFNRTVSDWKHNSSVMLNTNYPWSCPSLYIHRAIAWTKLRLACTAISGGEAYKFYLEAYARRVSKEIKNSKKERQ